MPRDLTCESASQEIIMDESLNALLETAEINSSVFSSPHRPSVVLGLAVAPTLPVERISGQSVNDKTGGEVISPIHPGKRNPTFQNLPHNEQGNSYVSHRTLRSGKTYWTSNFHLESTPIQDRQRKTLEPESLSQTMKELFLDDIDFQVDKDLSIFLNEFDDLNISTPKDFPSPDEPLRCDVNSDMMAMNLVPPCQVVIEDISHLLPQVKPSDEPPSEILQSVTRRKEVSCILPLNNGDRNSTSKFKEKDLCPDSNHSANPFPILEPSGCGETMINNLENLESISSQTANSHDEEYRDQQQTKPAIKWPAINAKDQWLMLDEKVHNQLKAHGKVCDKLKNLEKSIYDIGVELFGVQQKQYGSKKWPSRRTKQCVKLVIEKNALKSSIANSIVNEERSGFVLLLNQCMGKLRKLRKAERKLKNKTTYKKNARAFHQNPFKAGKDILDPQSQKDLSIDCARLDVHRSSTLNDPLADTPLQELEGLPPVKKTKTSFPTGSLRFPEFTSLLKTRRNASAPGLNMVPYKVYKACEHLARYLFNILLSVSSTQVIPVQWRCDKIIFIPKVSNPSGTELGDYRELALGNVEGKLFFSMVSNRLTRHIVNNNGFVNTSIQKGCINNIPGCWEHMSMMWEALNDAKEQSKNVSTVWLDLANAYGSIPHKLIFVALRRYGVPEKWCRIVENYYAGLWSKSFLPSATSSWHQHKRGIFTGCTVSIILFISAINIVIEYILAEQVERYQTKNGTLLPPVRAFMDDMNLMCANVTDTQRLLDRSCVALEWARMKYRPDKSRCIIIVKGKSSNTTPFITKAMDQSQKTVSSVIPSIHANPIKFLGRIVNGSLNDKNATQDIERKLVDGLKMIQNSKLGNKEKVWILSNLLIPRIRWPLMIYQIPITTGIELENKISFFLRKWLKLPRSITTIALYSKISPCALPLVSLTSILKSAKVSAYLQLRDSKDELVSAVRPRVKAGKWKAGESVKEAESFIRFKEMVGSPIGTEASNLVNLNQEKQGARPGLGLRVTIKKPKKGTKQHRKIVSNATSELQEEKYMAKSVQEVVQCHWHRWVNYVRNDLSWNKMMKMPLGLISFCINATFNTLPSPSNLARWKVPNVEKSCFLCSKTICTPAHILSACPVSLDQPRFSWRHDSVLHGIVEAIKKVATNITDIGKTSNKKSGMNFVRPGTKVPKPKQYQHRGFLHKASDWKLNADFNGAATIPFFLTQTTDRPDIVIYSKSKRKVIIIELTCPVEENFEIRHIEKSIKYNPLILEIQKNDWQVDSFAVEVGARGYCSTSLKQCFRALGFSSKQVRDSLPSIGRISLECSFHIWLSRNTSEWKLEGDVPWEGFANPLSLTKDKRLPTKDRLKPKRQRQAKTAKQGPQVRSVNTTSNKKTRSATVPEPSPHNAKQHRLNQLNKDWYSNTLSAQSTHPSASSPKSVPSESVTKKTANRSTQQRNVVVKSQYPKGLDSINNSTCYINSLLQALLCVPSCWTPYVEHIPSMPSLIKNFIGTLLAMKSANEGKSPIKTKKSPTQKSLLVETEPLLVQLQATKRKSGDRQFSWDKQNDVAEVLMVLVQAIEKVFGPWSMVSACPREIMSCKKCGETKTEEVNSSYLLLKPKESLADSLRQLLAEQSQTWKCPGCGKDTLVAQQMVLDSPPEVLIIQLDRSAPNPLRKNETVVKVSSQQLDLPIREGSLLKIYPYKLKSVVCHKGTVKSGHYFTIAEHAAKWYFFNDERVRLLTPKNINDTLNTRHSYMFMFEKVGGNI